MNKVKRMMAVWLSALLFAATLGTSPAGANDDHVEPDHGGHELGDPDHELDLPDDDPLVLDEMEVPRFDGHLV